MESNVEWLLHPSRYSFRVSFDKSGIKITNSREGGGGERERDRSLAAEGLIHRRRRINVIEAKKITRILDARRLMNYEKR